MDSILLDFTFLWRSIIVGFGLAIGAWAGIKVASWAFGPMQITTNNHTKIITKEAK